MNSVSSGFEKDEVFFAFYWLILFTKLSLLVKGGLCLLFCSTKVAIDLVRKYMFIGCCAEAFCLRCRVFLGCE